MGRIEDEILKNMTKLKKSLTYSTGAYRTSRVTNAKQVFLLKALQVTQDPKELRKIMGVKTVAEVYKTLDKLALRKQYVGAMSRAGIDFDYILQGIKKVADTGFKDSDRLGAYKVLLKSLGMDEYKEATGSSTSWEEELLRKTELEAAQKGDEKLLAGPKKYEVNKPELPESIKQKQKEEEEILSSIYDEKRTN